MMIAVVLIVFLCSRNLIHRAYPLFAVFPIISKLNENSRVNHLLLSELSKLFSRSRALNFTQHVNIAKY